MIQLVRAVQAAAVDDMQQISCFMNRTVPHVGNQGLCPGERLVGAMFGDEKDAVSAGQSRFGNGKMQAAMLKNTKITKLR